MTLQAKGFRWSVGIHGMLLAAIFALQISFVSEKELTVVDFTLADKKPSPVVEQPLRRTPAPLPVQKPRYVKSSQPEKIVEQIVDPNRNLEKEELAELPPQNSDNLEAKPELLPQMADDPVAASSGGGEIPPSLLSAQDGLGVLPAEGSLPNPVAATGSAEPLAVNSVNADTGATPEEVRAAYLKEHFVYIRDRITGGISYPHMARKMNWCGRVKIAFVVCEDGGVKDLRVVESSGFSILDRNTVDTVKKVAPFPKPPVRAEIRMAITYQLN
jgi:periplasmic protein TonB